MHATWNSLLGRNLGSYRSQNGNDLSGTVQANNPMFGAAQHCIWKSTGRI
jgi:hypothetical protein